MASGDSNQVNMDDPEQGQQPVMTSIQMTFMPAPYQTGQVVCTPSMSARQLPGPTQAQLAQQQLSYQHVRNQQLQLLDNQLRMFWAHQYQEVAATIDFKNHSLPLARIKKIMKADEDVRMIAAEAPVLFARACEMFILELTYRSWAYTEENKRRTLQKNDIAGAITRTDIFDFLADIVPKDELKDEGGLPSISMEGGPAADSLSFYYMPQQVGPGDPSMLYAQQPEHYIPQQLWEQQQTLEQSQQQPPQPPSEDS